MSDKKDVLICVKLNFTVYKDSKKKEISSEGEYNCKISKDNFLNALNSWVNSLGYKLIAEDDNIKVETNDKKCEATIEYYLDDKNTKFVFSNSFEKNILNGNIQWEIALKNNIIENGVYSPEYIKEKRSISDMIAASKHPMDMVSLLILLKNRFATIRIPEYERISTIDTSGRDIVLSGKNRNGKILALVSNQNTFNFSVRILDNNVIRDGKVGTPRLFSLTDEYGNLSDNWKDFKFIPEDCEENLVTDKQISFSRFINSEKAECFYSKWYYDMKLAIARLVQERKYLNSINEKYRNLIVTESIDSNNSNFSKHDLNHVSYEKKEVENKDVLESKKIDSFECVVDCPIISFSYINIFSDPKDVIDQCQYSLEGLNSKLEFYRFITRMVECAWFKSNGPDCKNFKTWNRTDLVWDKDMFQFPGKRTKWYRCNLPYGSLYCRYTKKTISKKIPNKD